MKLFGVRLDNLELSELKLVIELMQKTLQYQIQLVTDAETQEEKQHVQILHTEPQTIFYWHGFIGEEYKVPIILSLIGFEETVLGIRATAYFPEMVEESGVFWVLLDTEFKPLPSEKKIISQQEKLQNLVKSSQLYQKLVKQGG